MAGDEQLGGNEGIVKLKSLDGGNKQGKGGVRKFVFWHVAKRCKHSVVAAVDIECKGHGEKGDPNEH